MSEALSGMDRAFVQPVGRGHANVKYLRDLSVSERPACRSPISRKTANVVDFATANQNPRDGTQAVPYKSSLSF